MGHRRSNFEPNKKFIVFEFSPVAEFSTDAEFQYRHRIPKSVKLISKC